MCLTRTMVGILTQDHHFYLVERGLVKSIKDELTGRVDGGTGCPFCFQVGYYLQKKRFAEYRLECFFPGSFHLYIHGAAMSNENRQLQGTAIAGVYREQ
jgi:hypothetical protein